MYRRRNLEVEVEQYMNTMKQHCKQYRDNLVELALSPHHAPTHLAEVKTHVSDCASCQESLESLRATMAMMDTWSAPKLNPYFDVRMAARLREERAAAPASWLELLRARFQYLSNLQMRPLMAGALATCIMIGGGTFAGLKPAPVAPSATIVDLRIMDRNDQALQQMDQLMQDDKDSTTVGVSSLNP
jgi:hypothetical protein